MSPKGRVIGGLGLSVALVVGACGGQESAESETLEPSELAAVSDVEADSEHARGEAVFNSVCVACHTLEPPPNLAPPMMAVAGHYRDAFDTREEGVAAIAAWIESPSPEHSQLGAMAIDRFGLMAPLVLPDSLRFAVAGWVWDSYDANADPHRGGTGRMGPGHRGPPGGG